MNGIPLSKPTTTFTYWKKPPNVRRAISVPTESNSGQVSNELLDKVQTQRIETVTMPPDNIRLKRELEDILQECSNYDWDGYGAKSIDRISVQHIYNFLGNLHLSGIPYPELAPEPTGDLTMVWRKKGYHLIVGIDNSGQIAWGGTSPKGHVYGDAIFDAALDIPKELVDLLCSIEGIR